jgi:hypothetical protein
MNSLKKSMRWRHMNPDEYPDISCEPPEVAEVGDSWICPDCARKFHYILVTLQPENVVTEAWFTDELR